MKWFWIINLILFQACWFSAALLDEFRLQVMTILLLLHFLISPSKAIDARLLLLVPVGIALDKLLMEFGVMSAQSNSFPIWLVLLWSMFIISLNHSLRWLDELSWQAQMLIGAIGGAGSYVAGVSLGALDSQLGPSMLFLCLALVWGILIPLLIVLKRQLLGIGLSEHREVNHG